VIDLIVIDRGRVLVDALATRLAEEPAFRVLRTGTSAELLWQAVNRSSVDVVVCDAVLYDPAGFDHEQAEPRGGPEHDEGASSASSVRAARTPSVVLIADYDDGARLCPAIRSGIRGWVPRDASVNDLIVAIREASEGGTWIPPKVLTDLLRELTASSSSQDAKLKLLATLTSRERDVLACLTEGLGRVEVAARLHVSINTVRTHIQNILSKLGVKSSVSAVALARKAGPAAAMVGTRSSLARGGEVARRRSAPS